MILIGLGGNLESRFGAPEETLRTALSFFSTAGLFVKTVSPFYRAAPVPASTQPWFVNGVAEIETELSPSDVLAALLALEKKCGRTRQAYEEKNAARILDLDLLDYHGRVEKTAALTLPHPRMDARAFVLKPLHDIAPHWQHPVLGRTAHALLAALAPGQELQRL